MSPVQNVSTHIYGVSNEIDGKTFIFRVNLGMWPSNWSSWESEPCSEGFNTHLCSFQRDRWETFIFWVNLGNWFSNWSSCKNKPVLRVSTHMYGISKKIDGKTFIFLSKARYATSQIDLLGKMSPVLRVSTHIYGVSKEIDGKTFIFQVNLCNWPSNRSSGKNETCSEGFNTHLWVSNEIDGKTFISE